MAGRTSEANSLPRADKGRRARYSENICPSLEMLRTTRVRKENWFNLVAPRLLRSDRIWQLLTLPWRKPNPYSTRLRPSSA